MRTFQLDSIQVLPVYNQPAANHERHVVLGYYRFKHLWVVRPEKHSGDPVQIWNERQQRYMA